MAPYLPATLVIDQRLKWNLGDSLVLVLAFIFHVHQLSVHLPMHVVGVRRLPVEPPMRRSFPPSPACWKALGLRAWRRPPSP